MSVWLQVQVVAVRPKATTRVQVSQRFYNPIFQCRENWISGAILAVNWKKFRRIWENYEIATHLNKQDSSLRVATLLSFIGSDVLDIFDGLSFDV